MDLDLSRSRLIKPESSSKSLREDEKTFKKISFNLRKNQEQDNTERMDELAREFTYESCQNQYWNPANFSLLWGTELWNQASETQRVKLNQLYWVAYYAQIISAEIATIFFNQTCAASLYSLNDFRIVCDTLDLESMQERAHINAFQTISEQVEDKLFGGRLFTYPMRGPYVDTMIHWKATKLERFLRSQQLKAFALVSSTRPFIGCQYFTVRGLRTLNGKLVQHQLSQFYSKSSEKDHAPIPSKISFHHFLDESFHFNSSTIISHDVINSLAAPSRFDSWVANRGITGTQKDHYHFSTAINGLFWYDPALYPKIYKILRSPIFGMEEPEARLMMKKCFADESDGVRASFKTRNLALDSYQEYVSRLDYVTPANKKMSTMAGNSLEKHLKENQKGLHDFFRSVDSRKVS